MKKSYIFFLFLLVFSGLLKAQEKEPNNFEDWDVKPGIVSSAKKHMAPSDAIVLFYDNLNLWSFARGSEVTWLASKKGFEVVPDTESIQTKQAFGSCQLHVEWRIPKNEDHGTSLNWGNSGIFFMGLYEVQIYDSYHDLHKIYYNGQAGSIYKRHSPLVNCCKPSGKWETYDIVFTAPVFNEDGSICTPAYFTVFQNGILIQNHVELKGATNHSKYTAYQKHNERMPLLIQSHGSAVQYRNIWLREL